MNYYIRSIFFVLFLIALFSSELLSQKTNSHLNELAINISSIIKKSSEPDIYATEIKHGIAKYKKSLSIYSKKDIEYISTICMMFINLDIAMWDGLIEHDLKYGSSKTYNPKTNTQIKSLQKKLKMKGIKPKMETESPVATQEFTDWINNTSINERKNVLIKIRELMYSDYMNVYNSIFK